MLYTADLHIHSHYSRATSKDLNLESLYQWARIKGINVVGTGDFTHPLWFKELREKLEPDGNGLFRLKNPPKDPGLAGVKVHDIDVRFCLTTEISSIYKYGDKVRKNHNLVYAPDFDTVARINAKLSSIGNLEADGRPILGLPSRDLLEIVLASSDRAYLIPAHVWTPWFSTLGSKGGYDSIDECFRDLTDHIFAIETGLSSDPAMNWRWSALDRFTMISNSDAHSPQKLGREANLLNTDLSYDALFNAIKTGKGFAGTYEFFPEEGKYHHDGHRKCGVSLEPEDTIKYNGLCPSCGEPLTIGVLHRIEKLVDRKEPVKPEKAADFHYIIPLPEILGEIKNTGPNSKAVMQAFHQAISTFGNEFTLLRDVPIDDIQKQGNPILAEAIRRMRTQEVKPMAGYDGLYGVIRIFNEGELDKLAGQLHFVNNEPVSVKKRAVKAYDVQQNTAPDKDDTFFPIQLNEAQQQVKETTTGAVLVNAGPGTGKTNTLIHWINYQVQTTQAKASEVLAITFTNKAACEIKERLTNLLGDEVRNIRIGTFHSIGYHLLQERYPDMKTVYDEENRLSVIHFLFPELKDADTKKLCEALACLFELQDESGFENIQIYARRYLDYVKSQHAVDLADIVGQVILLWKEEPIWLERSRNAVKTIAADEFQDINALQYEFLQLLAKGKNILAIGDPDQSIYGFRGSDVKLFFRFADDFKATTISLTHNYRSTQNILTAASDVIQHNTLRSGVALQTTNPAGPRIKCFAAADPEQEAKYIIKEIEKQIGGFHLLTSGETYDTGRHAFSDIAVLYRTHAVGRELITHLKRSNIPVHLVDGSAYLSQAPFSFIADILKLYINHKDTIALYNVLHQAIGWQKQEIRTFLASLHETNTDWRETVPLSVSKNSKESFLRWRSFYDQLPAFFIQHGVNGALQEIFRQYLPENKLTEDQLLKKEIITTLAREAQADTAKFLEDTTLNAYTDTTGKQARGIHLLTFHAAKGLEFPVVFIAGAEEGITPSNRPGTDLEEERRLFYVGITRAKEELHITHAAQRILHGKEIQQQVSSFVKEIPTELCEQVKNKMNTQKAKDDQLKLF